MVYYSYAAQLTGMSAAGQQKNISSVPAFCGRSKRGFIAETPSFKNRSPLIFKRQSMFRLLSSDFDNFAPGGIAVEMQKAKCVGLSPAASQAAGIKIKRAILAVMIWQVGMPKQGDIDLAREFGSHSPDRIRRSAATMNKSDFEPLDLNYFFGRQAPADIGHIAITPDRLEMAQLSHLLQSLKRDQVAQMQNNILPRDPLHKGLREELISGQMSIRDDPDHGRLAIKPINRFID